MQRENVIDSRHVRSTIRVVVFQLLFTQCRLFLRYEHRAISHGRNKKVTGAELCPAVVSKIVYWGGACQLLGNIFRCP